MTQLSLITLLLRIAAVACVVGALYESWELHEALDSYRNFAATPDTLMHLDLSHPGRSESAHYHRDLYVHYLGGIALLLAGAFLLWYFTGPLARFLTREVK